jgi:uncharacterized hydrophobic protein (TIGR00271 family)
MERLKVIGRYIHHVLNIKIDQEPEKETHEEVISGVIFKGTNLWIMATAMLISCIGLNINSKAAVIGAMIISPLMGPIFGIGFGLGTTDTELIKLSMKNLVRIITICICCSTLYYLLNPYHVATEELLSFSSPTLFDILLAFFGGIAGFIALSRREGSRVLVGVAVATACIPPLCTTGYGIATLQWRYIIGGFYTYSLNCVFICLATYFMTRYLKFNRKETYRGKNVKAYFSALAFLMLLPGCYLAYQMGVKNIYRNKAECFIDEEIKANYLVVHQEIDHTKKKITVDISTERYDSTLEYRLRQRLKSSPLASSQLHIVQTTSNQAVIVEMQREIQGLKDKLSAMTKPLPASQ